MEKLTLSVNLLTMESYEKHHYDKELLANTGKRLSCSLYRLKSYSDLHGIRYPLTLWIVKDVKKFIMYIFVLIASLNEFDYPIYQVKRLLLGFFYTPDGVRLPQSMDHACNIRDS